MRARFHPFVIVTILLGVGCASQQAAVRPSSPPRIQPLDTVLANAEQATCVAGLHAIPATVIDTGVFKDVPYQSFSNGTVEVNAYGDPGDLVGLEAGTRSEDPALQQCLVQFIAAHTLDPNDRQRVLRMTAAPAMDQQPGLTVEVTPRTAADAYDAWWISLERPEAIAASRAPPEQLAEVTQPQEQWAPPPPTYYRRPPRAYVRYPTYRPAPPMRRVFVPTYTRRSGIYLRIR
ncbi:MAG: hypothetical protein JNJ54_20165 [Myxococcaceae bacterium]|nr:hypothetical protein [Myxococcaceae bacterium]